MEEIMNASSQSEDSEVEFSDDCFDDNYYNLTDGDIEQADPHLTNPEYFKYDCLTEEQVELLLNETVEVLSNNLQITPSLAKVLLHTHEWAVETVLAKYRENPNQTLISAKIKPSVTPLAGFVTSPHMTCPICFNSQLAGKFFSLSCTHRFCQDCWSMHFEMQISQGISTGISCMAHDCKVLAPEEFVLKHLSSPNMREKYQQHAFQDYVKSHPELRFCPGLNCQVVVRSTEPKAKRSVCCQCKTEFCFNCGMEYHAPTDCQVIKKWQRKCADDSETVNYINAHTKDCPKCHVCIEKNGGCNHMRCFSCKYEFCWLCVGDWKVHHSNHYECSRYKEDPNITQESAQSQAREALKKYLHYYERWENHSKSLKLEEQTLEKLRSHINKKVMEGCGTWIDWQYLFKGAGLLAKCRYTLQYTYPYAYYLEPGVRKELFEYQQAQLEAEIENLSWKIEHAETSDEASILNQMDVAEKRRTTLLKDFLGV